MNIPTGMSLHHDDDDVAEQHNQFLAHQQQIQQQQQRQVQQQQQQLHQQQQQPPSQRAASSAGDVEGVLPDDAMEAIHRLTSDLSAGFQCIVCPMIFRQLFSLVQHQQRHFIEDQLIEKSKAHGEDVPKKVFLEEIKEAAAGSSGGTEPPHPSEIRPHRCMNCNRTYSYGYYLEAHLKKCKAKKDSKAAAFCEVCGLQYGSKTTLIRHQIEKHGIRPDTGANADAGKLPCEYCDRLFDDLNMLDHHIAIDHGGDTPFKCSACEDSFSLKIQLDEHSLRAHNIGFMCEQCSKIFPKKRSLEMHVAQAHTLPYGTAKNIACDICDKRFAHQRFLKAHVMSTHKEKNHHCQYCGKAFSALEFLKRHERIHINGKQFKCRFCQKGFHLKGNRENHEMTHTGEKPLKCRYCRKGFIQKTALKKHEETHEHQMMDVLPKSLPTASRDFLRETSSDASSDSMRKDHFFNVH